MSAHTVIRYADWTIGPDPGPVTFVMRCAACAASSAPDEDFETVREWAFRHAGRNPSHTAYREVIHRHWRATLVR
ncbi:hypothetical protein ACFP1Z_14645 [Streptomyces gamaensis]|uniref:DUF7848 domain-containing protein n=1 Tax=Streptomyces gamaensis TaxID=1763542 RepID=A0ABW0Z0F9_9ACTN